MKTGTKTTAARLGTGFWSVGQIFSRKRVAETKKLSFYI
jgi:hypothetical protein